MREQWLRAFIRLTPFQFLVSVCLRFPLLGAARMERAGSSGEVLCL